MVHLGLEGRGGRRNIQGRWFGFSFKPDWVAGPPGLPESLDPVLLGWPQLDAFSLKLGPS